MSMKPHHMSYETLFAIGLKNRKLLSSDRGKIALVFILAM